MMSKYCAKIKLPFDPLIDYYNFSSQKENHIIIQDQYLNNNLIKFLLNFDIRVRYAECFLREEYSSQQIHVDGLLSDKCKINWIYGGLGSYMEWFTVLPNLNLDEIKYTKCGTPYSSYTLDQVTSVEKVELQNSYIVQVGTPHRVVNNTSNKRYCVSLSIRSNRDNSFLNFETLCTKLSEYLISP